MFILNKKLISSLSLSFLIIAHPITSLASWTQPITIAPGGNTEPPLNVSINPQIKSGMIGATEFCIYKSDKTTKIGCVGGYDNNFPWIEVNDNPKLGNSALKNTNTGNTYVNSDTVESLWAYPQMEKLTVGGGVKATKFCLGNSCMTIPTVGDTLNNWSIAIKKILTGSETSCADGEVLKWSSSTSRWVCGVGGSASTFTETDTLDTVVKRNAMTDEPISVGGILVDPGNAVFTGMVGIGTVSPSKKLEVVGGPIKATGGLIIQTMTKAQSDTAFPSMEEGRLWLITDVAVTTP